MTSHKDKPLAALSLDLDNQWSYMKIHGDSGWNEYPSYFDVFIPLVLEMLDKLDLKITFFIVGQDAALAKNQAALKLITHKGHEVGNHSFHHEPWLHAYSREKIKGEVQETENSIFKITGQKPVGFRGPGFSWSKELFEVLLENNYLYDASTLPMSLGPIARVYYFWKSNLNEREKTQRKDLYGSFRDGFRPGNPYLWKLNSGRHFLEIPVTTIPILKLPFHLSYLQYLSRFSDGLMLFYLNIAIRLCRMTRISPSFLLHPLDLIGGDQVPELAFFPGMDMNGDKKKKIFYRVMNTLMSNFRFVKLSSYAHAVLEGEDLSVINP
jgi:hypothetical protein